MTLLRQHIPKERRLGGEKGKNTHQSFIASKVIANVLDTVKPRTLIALPVTATVEQAFNLLLSEDILSVPVYQLEEDGEKKTYLTIVSRLDLLKLSSQQTPDIANNNFFHHQIKEIIGKTEESSILVRVQYSDALVDVLHLFSKYSAHRVLVTSKANQIEQPPVFLGQMDIIRYFQAHNHHLGAILDKYVPDLVQRSSQLRQKRLHLDYPPQLATVSFKATAIMAFEKMANDPFINSLPILDDSGYLVGDISPKHLRGLNKSQLKDLFNPVLIFLKSSNDDFLAPITCHHRFTLSQIMAAFVLREVFQLWWIDQEGHFQGVIQLTDVLEILSDDSSDF